MIEKMIWVSSLAKVFWGKEPGENLNGESLSFLANERFSVQCAFRTTKEAYGHVKITPQGDLAKSVTVREVCLMPSRFAGMSDEGENPCYEPGMYPDLLKKPAENGIRLYPNQWQSVLLTIELEKKEQEKLLEQVKGGGSCERELRICAETPEGEVLSDSIFLRILPTCLPKQKLIHTEWFHADCLADYYRVEPWSEEHWNIVENFLRHYRKMGMNMVLVPAFTPPLDTAVGKTRTNVQLVEVSCEADGYRFDMGNLERFIKLCRKVGIEYYEMSHLFSQWGAKSAGRVMAKKNGEITELFGWETKAESEEYLTFLKAYLTELMKYLKEWGIKDRVFFHLSDEPGEDCQEHYLFLSKQLKPYLEGCPVIDALSRYAFYESGALDRAVVSEQELHTFMENGAEHLWTYYCGAHYEEVPNRYFAMPMYRTRILGILLYYLEIEGFLHWGFNFYNTQYSLSQLNPYSVTDAGGSFASGDSFLVYPGEDGKPEDSLRMIAMLDAMQDIRALELLEQYRGRKWVREWIVKQAGGELSMKHYPRTNAFLFQLRQQVNELIEQEMKK